MSLEELHTTRAVVKIEPEDSQRLHKTLGLRKSRIVYVDCFSINSSKYFISFDFFRCGKPKHRIKPGLTLRSQSSGELCEYERLLQFKHCHCALLIALHSLLVGRRMLNDVGCAFDKNVLRTNNCRSE